MVPDAEFTSYYGRQIIKSPTWKNPEVPLYLFLGGAGGTSAIIGALGEFTGRRSLTKAAHFTAAGGALASVALLIVDLGRPARFLHMLRVVKPTSPMSIGTWLLAGFAPLAALAAADEARGVLPAPIRPLTGALARPSGLAAAALAPAVTTYTAALIANTAVPVWHHPHRELPYLFGASSLAASGGLAAAASPSSEAGPARAVAVAGAVAEQILDRVIHQRLGMVAEPLSQGRAGRYLTAARWSTRAGAVLLAASAVRRSRALDVAGGLALTAGSLFTRLGYFHAGTASATDPRYTVIPQRERLDGPGAP
jgi:hypothetical protein